MALKILLADDSMTAQNMGKKILTDAGYEVVTVSNGAAALKKLPEFAPDILLLDVYMPGYSGLEVSDRVKNSSKTQHIPVLLTVGKLEPFRPEEGMRAKADGVIIKPFEASDLITVVSKLAGRVRPPTPAVAEPAPPPVSATAEPDAGQASKADSELHASDHADIDLCESHAEPLSEALEGAQLNAASEASLAPAEPEPPQHSGAALADSQERAPTAIATAEIEPPVDGNEAGDKAIASPADSIAENPVEQADSAEAEPVVLPDADVEHLEVEPVFASSAAENETPASSQALSAEEPAEVLRFELLLSPVDFEDVPEFEIVLPAFEPITKDERVLIRERFFAMLPPVPKEPTLEELPSVDQELGAEAHPE